MPIMSRWVSVPIMWMLLGSAVVCGQEYGAYEYDDDDYIIVDDCPDMVVTCACGIGNGTEEVKQVKVKQFAVMNEIGQMECLNQQDALQICGDYACPGTPNLTEKFEGPNPLKKKRNIVASFYPHEIVIPRGGNSSLARWARQADACVIPTLKNAEIKCWKWPNWINCDINCIYGYALANSKGSLKTTNLNCRLTENQWKPHAFEDCQPFVNCKAHLTKPGDLKCKSPTDGPAYCEISCLDYDQYEATPLQKYECVDEDFAKALPHCATLKDVSLVRKPEN